MINSYSLAELAELAGAKLVGDGQAVISGFASITSAKPGQISFLGDSKYRPQLAMCQASALIISSSELPNWPHFALVVADPYLAYARIARCFDDAPQEERKVSTTAIVAPGVVLGRGVAVGDFTVIDSGASIADGVVIGSHCFIGKNVKIGHNTRLFSGVNIYHGVSLGEDCLLHSGVVVGSDGFGFASDKGEWVKIPQLGGVRIGSKVEIGANTTIDRGALDDTIIGDGVIIDNQCHVAHNVAIGEHTAIAGGAILSGGLKIGRYCRIGGASVINGHMEICDRAFITGMAMVMRPITEPGVYSSGIPAQSNRAWRKMTAQVMHIDQMNKRIKALERTSKKDKS